MKRFLASALVLGSISGFGLVGCSDETKTKDQSTVSGPGGKTVETTEKSVKSSGDGGTATPVK